MSSPAAPPRAGIPLWDLPVRLTHWLLVLFVLTSWVTAENRWLELHRVSGYAILTLILFRLYWGFFGSTPARFAHFLCGPGAVVRTLVGKNKCASYGHNPLGGWSVLAMLSALLLQATFGLFAVDIDGLESGPLATQVSFETGRQAAQVHASVFNLLLLLIALHVAAILFYLAIKRENLILPMVTGRKQILPEAMPITYRFVSLWRALLGIAIAALVVIGIANF